MQLRRAGTSPANTFNPVEHPMTKLPLTFPEILKAAESLSPEEQEALVEALKKRVAERHRDEMDEAAFAAIYQISAMDLTLADRGMDHAYRAALQMKQEEPSESPDPEDLMWGILA